MGDVPGSLDGFLQGYGFYEEIRPNEGNNPNDREEYNCKQCPCNHIHEQGRERDGCWADDIEVMVRVGDVCVLKYEWEKRKCSHGEKYESIHGFKRVES